MLRSLIAASEHRGTKRCPGTSSAGDVGSIPGGGTKISHASGCSQKDFLRFKNK